MNKRLSILTAAVLFLSTAAITFISCDKDDDPTPTPEPEMVATSIELVSGEDQTDFAEATLADAVEVLIKDQEGNAFVGEVVKFTVTEGSVSAANATTDANGKASVTWTLGATEDTQTLNITGTSTLTGAPLSVTATAEYKPVIGDFKYGGVIFYIDATGTSGLVCTATDISTNADWGCQGVTISGADGTAIGTGVQNTLDILVGCDIEGTAADLCNSLTHNSYDDWFLPSIDALAEIYKNIDLITTTALSNGGTAFASLEDYWSSSENTSDNLFAYGYAFYAGVSTDEGKSNINRVRAIREF